MKRRHVEGPTTRKAARRGEGGTQRRIASLAAWGLVAAGAVASLGALQRAAAGGVRLLEDVFLVLASLGLVVVGALIVRRRPGNRIGWMLAVVGAAFPGDHLGGRLGAACAHASDPPAAAVWVAWVLNWAGLVPITLVFFVLPVVFPDGRLPSRRWRPLGWVVGAAVVVYPLAFAVVPGPMEAVQEQVWDTPSASTPSDHWPRRSSRRTNSWPRRRCWRSSPRSSPAGAAPAVWNASR